MMYDHVSHLVFNSALLAALFRALFIGIGGFTPPISASLCCPFTAGGVLRRGHAFLQTQGTLSKPLSHWTKEQ